MEIKRPKIVSILAIMQWSLAALVFTSAIILALLTGIKDMRLNNDSYDYMMGLAMGSIVIMTLGVGILISGSALWRMKTWGRWLALMTNGLIFCTLIYGNIDDYRSHTLERDELALTMGFVIPFIPFFLPAVGRALKKPAQSPDTHPLN